MVDVHRGKVASLRGYAAPLAWRCYRTAIGVGVEVIVHLLFHFLIAYIMAKGNMFLSQARGKVGSVVFAVVKGQQTSRVHNPKPANPKTYGQQAQRSLLANMTKFYKHGTSQFYKFAFEDKTVRESDFNAFARNNMQRGVYMHRMFYESQYVPALGRYKIASGSLVSNIRTIFNGDLCVFDFGANSISGTAATVTVGQVSTAILVNNPGLAPGDILTFVLADSSMEANQTYADYVPTWQIYQFVIDANDTRTIASVGLDFQSLQISGTTGQRGVLTVSIKGVDRASFGACIASRNTTGGLLVSNSDIVLSAVGSVLTDWLRGDYAKREAAISWGGNPEAILQGGLLESLPNITTVKVGNQIAQSAYAYSQMLVESGAASRTIVVSGSALRTTAAGGDWRVKIYRATLDYEDAGLVYTETEGEVALTATGTASSISIVLPDDASIIANTSQGYYLLTYNGVPFSYGTFVQSI